MALTLSSQSLMVNVEQILEELASIGNCSLKPFPLFFSLFYITTHLEFYLTFYKEMFCSENRSCLRECIHNSANRSI